MVYHCLVEHVLYNGAFNSGGTAVIFLVFLLSLFLLVLKRMLDESKGRIVPKEKKKKTKGPKEPDPEQNYQDLIKQEELRTSRYTKNIPGAGLADKLLKKEKEEDK